MKSLSSFLFLVLFSLKVFGADIQAELHLISAPSVLKEGDIVEGLLKVWPIENVDLNEFKQLDNMILANSLIVTEVESVEGSANNADVIEAKLLFIVKRSKEDVSAPFNYKGQLISIQVPPLQIEASGKGPVDYFVMDQGVLSSNFKKVIMGSGAILLICILLWKRNSIKKLIQRMKADPVAVAIKKYREFFLNANTRQDYENIYALKDEWYKLIVTQAPAYKEFFKIMEQHQYKKNWGVDEFTEVKSSFDVIRGSFK